MSRIVLKALLLSTVLLAGSAGAASAGATMQVSFTVQSSCTVKAPDGAAPTVACGRDVPFQVAAQADQATAPAGSAAPAAAVAGDTQAHGAVWQISF